MKKNGLNRSLLCMSTIPMLLMGIIITLFSAGRFSDTIYRQVKNGLADTGNSVRVMYDLMLPGDYTLVKGDMVVILKGKEEFTGKNDIIDRVKQETGTEISFFYQDTRVLTTLMNEDGKRQLGTVANAVVKQEVLNKGQDAFYRNVNVGGKSYFAYYFPLRNSNDKVIGMLAVAKPSNEVRSAIRKAVMPILVISVLCMLVAAYFAIKYAKTLIAILMKMRYFIVDVSNGNLTGTLDSSVTRRTDELGEIGNSVVKMQKSIKGMVEQDALTGLYNRRYANKKMEKIISESTQNGVPFSIVMCDIDYFKKVNDTYGHEAGDAVLKAVADILHVHMVGRGFASRWGGEEFLLIYEALESPAARYEVEKIMKAIRSLEVPYQENLIHLTMTFGVVQGHIELSSDEMIKEADNRLYIGKESGRNQIVG